MTLAKNLFHRFKGFASDSAWQLGQDFLALIVVFVSFTLLNTSLSSEAGDSVNKAELYGPYILVYAVVGPIGALTWSGIGLAAFQRISQYEEDKNEVLKKYGSFYAVSALLFIPVAVGILAHVLDGSLPLLYILLYVLSELAMRAFINLSSWFIQTQNGFIPAAKIRIFTEVIKLFVFLGLFFNDSLTIKNIGLFIFIGYLLYAVVVLLFFLPAAGFTISFAMLDKKTFKHILTFSIPMGSSMFQKDGDKIFLGMFASDETVGLYGAAYRVASMGLVPITALHSAAFPRFLKRKDEKNFYLKRSFYFSTFLFLFALVIIAGMFLALPLLQWFFDEDFDGATDILIWLLPFIPLSAISGTPMDGLLGMQKNTQRALVYLSSAVFSVSLYLILIPLYSWKGAAIATILSETYLAIASWATMFYYQKKANQALATQSQADLETAT